MAIKSFKGEWAELILAGRKIPKGVPADIASVAGRKLVMVDSAARLQDLASPPANRLEPLKAI